jgi:Na+/melibiose symporter-like transporter
LRYTHGESYPSDIPCAALAQNRPYMTTYISRPLRRRDQLGYGAIDLGIAAVESLVQLYLLKFYHDVMGLPSTWVGIALAIAILWDAVSDPLMGGISDRTHHAEGRRRPYFLPGALLMALSFALIFNPPALGSGALSFAYLLVVFVALNTSMTLVAVPHAALGGEMSFDRHERSALFGFKRLFATLGALLGLVLPALLLDYWNAGESEELVVRSRSATSWLLAPIIVATAWVSYRVTRGLDRPHLEGERLRLSQVWPLFAEQRFALQNPLFLWLAIAFVVAAVGRTLNASIALYYYEYRLALSEQEAVQWILLPFFVCFIASVPFWVWLGRRWGKKKAALSGVLSLGLSTAVVYPLFPAGQIFWPLLYSIVGGAMAGAIVLLDSLVADSIDYDRLRWRQEREGLYFGVWKMSTKVSRALGLVLAGALLDLIGFQEGTASVGPLVADRLALVFGPAVGALFVAAGCLLWCMPLDDALHERIQNLLRRREKNI